jgi:Dolichyl-phosphate-mannose-protein mannosyltransferase
LFTNLFCPGKLQRVLALLFLLSLPLVNPIVHGDGVGYYAYVRAPLIQHNLHFEEDWRHANLYFSQARTAPNGQLLPEEYTETGYVSNLFTIGPALLWAPFLLVAHWLVLSLDLLGMHIPANGFSFPYIFAMALGTAVYGFLGLLLSFFLARKYMAERWALLATIAIWWASSLPVYMYFNPAWSHAHSTFAVALFLWYWDRTRDTRSTGQWLILGLIAGLMLDIYFPNGIFLLLPFVESLQIYSRNLKTQPRALLTLFVHNLLFICVIILAFLPTSITRQIIFGGYLRFGSYSHLPWDWSAPHWRAVLFSSDHGLFSWTPVLFLALLGLFFVPRASRALALYLGLAAIAFYYLIASYPYWDGLSSFGNRFMISLTPIYIFGLTALIQCIASKFASRRAAILVTSTVLTGFILWNLGLIYQWGAHLIPPRGPISFREASYNQFFVVPEKLSGNLRTYVFHRNQLMQQIEQKDVEELRKKAQP